MGGEGEVTVACDSQRAVFQMGAVSVATRLVEGPYLGIDRVLAQREVKQYHICGVSRDALLRAVRRVSLSAADAAHMTRLLFDTSRLGVRSDGADTGSAEEDIPATYTGDAFGIGFNGRFLADVLEHFPCDDIQVCVRGANHAMFIEAADPAQRNAHTAMLMPRADGGR